MQLRCHCRVTLKHLGVTSGSIEVNVLPLRDHIGHTLCSSGCHVSFSLGQALGSCKEKQILKIWALVNNLENLDLHYR